MLWPQYWVREGVPGGGRSGGRTALSIWVFHFVFALDVARNVVLIFVGLEVVYKIADILLELLLDLPPNLRLPQGHMAPHVQRFPKIGARAFQTLQNDGIM